MADLFRETAFGKLVHFLSKGTLLQYPEERADFVVPEQYVPGWKPSVESTSTLVLACGGDDLEANTEKTTAPPSAAPSFKSTPAFVDWYGDNDPDNPQNWSSGKKALVTYIICSLTFAVYVGSSLITSGFGSLVEEFGIGEQETTVSLSVYVLSYGVGALFFSPLSEIPAFGRNPFYWAPMVAFVAFQAGAARTPTYTGLVLLRALTALCGSPILSTGGATLADMFTPMQLPVVFSVWVLPAFSAPAIGPVFGNFAAQAKGWRWTMYELLWIVGFVTLFLVFLMPETSHANILLRRAKRLRALTGNNALRSQSEIDHGEHTPAKMITDALIRPIQITVLDPSIGFANLYISFVYAWYYLFFASFPIVYGEIFKFSFGAQGLTYLNLAMGGALGAAFYIGYQYIVMNPYYAKVGWPVNEKRLEPALISAIVAPIGLFIFAWTAKASLHWISSMVGVTLFVAANFATLQCMCIYIVLSYPQFAASLLAGNDAFRSLTAAAFLHAGGPMFRAMGIGGGVSFLGGLTLLGIPGVWAIWYWGASLRRKSRFAQGDAQ